MQVSIIIVNYNTKELTKQAIQSVVDKTEGVEYEIIVVDNDSKDGSVEELKKIFQNKITIIESKENLGFGRANNLGIKQSKGKYVFLLNSDTELINNAIKIFYDYMEQNMQVGVCGGNLYNINNEPATSYCMYKKNINSYIYWRIVQIISKLFAIFNRKKFYCNFNYSNKVKEVGYISGADMFIRRKALDKSGLFDENIFMYGEDIDLNFRIKECGYLIKSIPQAKIFHLENASFKIDTDENILKNYKIRKHSEYNFYFKTFGRFSCFIYLETQITNIIKILINFLLPYFLLKKIYLIVKSTNVYKQMFKIDKKEYINSINKKNNILIFANAAMGDFIWVTSVFRLIKDYDKNINITLITSKYYIDFIDNNIIKTVVTTNPKYHKKKNKIIRITYKIYWLITNYYKLIDNDTVLFLDISKFMAFSAQKILKIKNIIGPSILWLGYNTKNPDVKYYTKQIPLPKDQDKKHIMIRYQTLVRNIFPTYNLSLPILPDTSSHSEKIKRLIGKAKKYKIALCTMGSVSWRYWDVKYFEELIIKINNDFDSTFFIMGSSKAELQNAEILKNSLKNTDIINLCGKTSISDLKEILRNMDLLVSVDTGIIHLAAVYKIPTISLHGSTLPEQSMPVNKNAVILCSYRECSPCNYKCWETNEGCREPKCMYDITPDMVFYEVKKILK